jgi:hypothetical protein
MKTIKLPPMVQNGKAVAVRAQAAPSGVDSQITYCFRHPLPPFAMWTASGKTQALTGRKPSVENPRQNGPKRPRTTQRDPPIGVRRGHPVAWPSHWYVEYSERKDKNDGRKEANKRRHGLIKNKHEYKEKMSNRR